MGQNHQGQALSKNSKQQGEVGEALKASVCFPGDRSQLTDLVLGQFCFLMDEIKQTSTMLKLAVNY